MAVNYFFEFAFDRFMRASLLRTVVWSGFWTFGWAFVLADLWRNPKMPSEKRRFWIKVLVVGNFFALPIYWWHYVRGAAPNLGVSADHDPRERGSRPLNTDR